MNCLFCRIAAGEIPAKLLYGDADMVAFYDIQPQAPVHFLVIPRKHIANMYELTPEDKALMGAIMHKGQELAQELGLENGARFVLNCKADGGQTVDHLHLHVLGGRSMSWPPG